MEASEGAADEALDLIDLKDAPLLKAVPECALLLDEPALWPQGGAGTDPSETCC